MLTREQLYPVITVADNTTETPDVTVQFKNGSEENHAGLVMFDFFLTTDAGAQTLVTDGTDTSEIAIKTNGVILVEHTADVMGKAITEATGLADFTITIVTTKQAVLNIVVNGRVYQSDVMTYTA